MLNDDPEIKMNETVNVHLINPLQLAGVEGARTHSNFYEVAQQKK